MPLTNAAFLFFLLCYQNISGWVKVAAKKYNVLLLDQRGTGLSTPITVQSLSRFKTAQEQAEYFMQFRADSIVRDSELIRETLLGNKGTGEMNNPTIKVWSLRINE